MSHVVTLVNFHRRLNGVELDRLATHLGGPFEVVESFVGRGGDAGDEALAAVARAGVDWSSAYVCAIPPYHNVQLTVSLAKAIALSGRRFAMEWIIPDVTVPGRLPDTRDIRTARAKLAA